MICYDLQLGRWIFFYFKGPKLFKLSGKAHGVANNFHPFKYKNNNSVSVDFKEISRNLCLPYRYLIKLHHDYKKKSAKNSGIVFCNL
jgi:hypothetical protein